MNAMIPMPDRFWAKVNKTDNCWEWTGAKTPFGYGQIGRPGRNNGTVLAHRYSAMLHFGMFDRRLFVLHHCDNPSCVNPDHLYFGDHQQNADDKMLRGRHAGANATHCKNGHEFTPGNTYLYQGRRKCKSCHRKRSREWQQKHRQQQRAVI